MRAVNLIPAEQRGGGGVGVGRSQGAAYAVLALMGGVALLALLWGVAHHQISSRRAQAASLAAQAQRAQALTSQLAPYTSFISLRETRLQAVTQLVDTRFDWAHAFHELGRVLPANISLASVTGQIGSASGASAGAPASKPPPAGGASSASASSASASSVTSATPPGTVPQFVLSGCATSQPAVAAMLDRLRLMDGVAEVTLQSSTKGSSGAGGGGGAQGCAASSPAFTVQVSYQPMPAPSASTGPARTPAANVTPAPAGASANSAGATK